MNWETRSIPIKYQLSDWTLFSIRLKLQCRRIGILDKPEPLLPPDPDQTEPDTQGFMIRACPVTEKLPTISRQGAYLRYVYQTYQHGHIDLSMAYDDYLNHFSKKYRKSMERKIKRYRKQCSCVISFQTYKTREEIQTFFNLACKVSEKSYQERLLHVGIPCNKAFTHRAEKLADDDLVRGYILFVSEQPVSYIYCPADGNVLSCAYIGYDPDYKKYSVGTLLHWFALEAIFNEKRFEYFDLTDGESNLKSHLATHKRDCANIFFIRNTLINKAIIYTHAATNKLSYCLGNVCDCLGIRAKIKHLIRFGEV